MSEAKRYLGLELAGAKNLKTAVAALEYYPKEKKIFLLDIYDKLNPVHSQKTSDEALLEIFEELKPSTCKVGVNVPLALPPCITCTKRLCATSGKCSEPAVKWMRDFTKKIHRSGEYAGKAKEFTPFTQRPVELWMKYLVLQSLPEAYRFEIDETLGGNKAPLTARMHYLKKHLTDFELIEVWPKLSVAKLALELGINKRLVTSYRKLEEGVHAREKIIEILAEQEGIFIYERDVRKLAHSLPTFDSFICAFTALLSDTGRCVKMPAGFPAQSGWVSYPLGTG